MPLNCRQLLQAQVDAAAGEVVAARAEIASGKKVLEDDLEAARTALASMKPPVSDTPLADRLGLPGWKIDLLAAALASLAANGLVPSSLLSLLTETSARHSHQRPATR